MAIAGPCSDKPSAGRDRQDIDKAVAANGDKLVEHVHRDTDMVRHNPQYIADSRPPVTIRDVEESMLLGHGVDSRLGMFKDQAEPVQPAGVRRECLRSRIQNTAALAGAADNAGEDVQRTIPDIGHAGGHHHPVVEDGGAGTMFRGAVKTPQIHQVWRAAGGNDVGGEAEIGKALAGGIKEALRRRPPVLCG